MKNKRTPKQNRSIETQARILDAGFDLFSRKGLQGTSSREIARAAGVSIGSFYSYFKDKRALFIALLTRHRGNVLKILKTFSLEEVMDEDPYKRIHQLVKEIWASHESINDFGQKADMLRNIDAEIDAILKAQESEVLANGIMILEQWAKRLRKEDIGLSAMIVFLTIQQFMHTVPRTIPKDDMERILEELTDMIVRYLFK